MAFNGSGTYVRVHNWQDDADANIDIEPDRMDAEDDGFATGLSTCITKDGQTTVTANIPMNSHKFTGLAVGTAATDSATLGQAQTNAAGYIAAGGTADAITATYSPSITALVDGMIVRVRAGAANATTTPTFAPNGLTAHTITKNGNQALVAGDIFGSGHDLLLEYNLAGTRWELLNPGGYLSAATAASTYAPIASRVPTGASIIWNTSTAPAGFLEENGSAISRTTYAALFAVIGTTFGVGDGSTTFNLPDSRGYFVRGWDHGAGVDTGRTFGSTQVDSFASHTHTATVTDLGHTHGGRVGITDVNIAGGSGNASPYTSENIPSATTGITVSNAATGSSETRPINIAKMWIIKT